MEEKKLPRILITDDEEFMRSNIDFILPDEKYQKLFAISGEECFCKAKENLPHLILLDVGMPGSDGIETCKKLKKDPITKDIPVIFITGKNLNTENLKVTSFCQVFKNQKWVNKKVDESNNTKIENAILNNAKKLKLQST